ncbi:MAG: hypothetical protein ABI923_09800 [bacterium]
MNWKNGNYQTAVLLTGLFVLLSATGTLLGQGPTGRERTPPPKKTSE